MNQRSGITTTPLSMRRWRPCLRKNAERGSELPASISVENSGKPKPRIVSLAFPKRGFLRILRISNQELDVCAMRDDALRAGSRCRKFDGERDFALVAQNAELDGLVFVFVLGFALCGKLLAQVTDRANALAIDGSNYVAGFEPTLFGRRAGIHVTNQNAFAIGRAEEAAELAVKVFRVDAEPRLATHHQAAAVPFHGRNHRNFRHGK